MADQSKRSARVVVDIWECPLTEDHREGHKRHVEASPQVNYLPINTAWGLRIDLREDPEELAEAPPGAGSALDNERVPMLISRIRRSTSVQLALQFRGPVVPLDPRFRKLIGSGRRADDAEVAERLAELLNLPTPTSHASRELLVLMAILAQGWYDDPWAPYDSTALGSEIGGRIRSMMGEADFATAMEELGLVEGVGDGGGTPIWFKYEMRLWPIAARLVHDEMAFTPLWGGH